MYCRLSHCGYKISIFKYFKLLPQNDVLPDPNGLLSGKVPTGAIAAANQKVYGETLCRTRGLITN